MEKEKKILIIFGTRPEAIKLSPLIKELEKQKSSKVLTCVLRQQTKLLDDPLRVFEIKPSFDIQFPFGNHGLMNPNVFIKIKSAVSIGFGFLKLLKIFKKERPALLIVQGDTSTVFLSAFIAAHFKIPIAHIEAGLRTNDKYSPFPEEINRRLVGVITDLHFAATESARTNLLKEGVNSENIWVTGNTVIDALRIVLEREKGFEIKDFFKSKYKIELDNDKKVLLVTAHRRESFGEGLENICEAVKEIAKREDVIIVFPVHPNPNVRKLVFSKLSTSKNIHLIEPLGYKEFIFLMERSYFILTDSGGIQEEVSFLGKPTLVMRKVTERPEGISAGNAILVGTDRSLIIKNAYELIENNEFYKKMSVKHFSFGDGHASEKIAKAISEYLSV